MISGRARPRRQPTGAACRRSQAAMTQGAQMTIVTDDNTATPAGSGADAARWSVSLAVALRAARGLGDLLDALGGSRLWLPLPDDGRPVTDGSAVDAADRHLPGQPSSCPRSPRRRGCGPRCRGPGRPCRWCMPPPVAAARRRSRRRAGQAAARRAGHRAQSRHGPERAGVPGGRRVPGRGAAFRCVAARTGGPSADAGWTPARRRSGPGCVRSAASPGRGGCVALRRFAGEGLVISVALDDPADAAARDAVVVAIERAAAAAPQDPGFPVDVTFPGEGAPDSVDEWVSACAGPFYLRPDRRPAARRAWRRLPRSWLIRHHRGIASRGAGQAAGRSRATRLSALITPRSDACTIDSLMPTPHSTRSPTWISR